MENLDGEDFTVSGLVESLPGIGKDWSSLIIEPVVKRFLRAGDVVLEKKSWNEIPGSNRRAVEAAADALGLSIEELRRRIRVAAQEEPPAPCGIILEDVQGGIMRRTTDAGEDTVVVHATGDSLKNLSIAPNVKRDRMDAGPSKLEREKNEERNISEIWKAMEIMQLN